MIKFVSDLQQVGGFIRVFPKQLVLYLIVGLYTVMVSVINLIDCIFFCQITKTQRFDEHAIIRTITPANQESTLCRSLLLSGNLISGHHSSSHYRGREQTKTIYPVIDEMSALM